MSHARISHLEREVDLIKEESDVVKNDVEKIKRELVDKAPDHFSEKDLLRSFIGSMFLGFSVIFSSNLLGVAKILPSQHIYVIIAFTLIVLSAEIYFIGYSRVEDKQHRKFGQFWIKRIIAFYGVALVVALMLIYIFGLVYLVLTPEVLFNAIILMSAPCAIGASFADLVKKY